MCYQTLKWNKYKKIQTTYAVLQQWQKASALG